MKIHRDSLDALSSFLLFGLFTGTSSGKIISCNSVFLSLIDYPLKEKPSLNWKKLTAKQYLYKDRLALDTIKHGRKVQPYEKAFICRDGSLVDCLTGIIATEEDDTFTAFVIDISDTKEKRRKAQENLYFASHELKTPLTSIKGFINLLQRKIKKREYDEIDQYTGLILENLKRIEHISQDISQTLMTDKDQFDLQISTFNPCDLILSAVKVVQSMSKRHTIKLELCELDCTITGDWFRLEQVITNLLTNAVKYSPNADIIHVKAELTSDKLLIKVTDFGVGIAPTELNKIFDPFYRVKETADTFSGLGIGLYLSAQVVQRHNGRMTVSSTKDSGTTFTVHIPVTIPHKTYEKAYTRPGGR